VSHVAEEVAPRLNVVLVALVTHGLPARFDRFCRVKATLLLPTRNMREHSLLSPKL
jgi:hypothetical protein